MTEWELYSVLAAGKCKREGISTAVHLNDVADTSRLRTYLEPLKTPCSARSFVIALLTKMECDIANLNSFLVAPACMTQQDPKTADRATVVQLSKWKTYAFRPL
jgi:hypothetical protein